MTFFRKIITLFKWIRVLVLLSVLVASLGLFYLSQNNDPRFFYLLSHPLGQELCRVMGWNEVVQPFRDKPDEALSELEKEVKKKLEKKVGGSFASDIILLKDGRRFAGNVIETTETHLTLREDFSGSGNAEFTFPKSRIATHTSSDEKTPQITYRDVRFSMEFPDFNFYRKPPYTIVTRQKYFDVQKNVKILQGLHERFVDVFGELITVPERVDNVQIVFFADEEEFATYQRIKAPQLEHSVGFYSPIEDRFVVFAHETSSQFKHAQKRIEAAQSRYSKYYRSHDVKDWAAKERSRLRNMAEDETRRTLRHEGAHQLFHSLGIHSPFRAENLWLIEGLAQYCETSPMGRSSRFTVTLLNAANEEGDLFPFKALVNHRTQNGWQDLPGGRIDLGYAQSWLMVNRLMKPDFRPIFFEYLNYIRSPDTLLIWSKTSRFELLAERLGLTTDALESEFFNHLRNI